MSKDFESRGLDLPRPIGYMKNPFIGDDGKDYHSPASLRVANQAHFENTHHFKSPVLGREYPPTLFGAAQMRRDEAAYRNSQKITHPKVLQKIEIGNKIF